MAKEKKRSTSARKDEKEESRQSRSEESRAEQANDQEGAKESQEESQQDSQLTTPQPDQPAPTEVERREGQPRKDDSDSEPRRQESETADDEQEGPPRQEPQPDQPEEFVKHVIHGGRSFRADVLVDDQHAVEAQRQDELAEAREKHAQKSGFGELVSAEK